MSSTPSTKSICPYSLYSVQFYLLFPIIKWGQYLQLPSLVSYLIAMGTPIVVTEYVLRWAAKFQLVTFVSHQPQPDHPHSRTITFSVIAQSAILGVIATTGLSILMDDLVESQCKPFGLYLILLSFFHFSEYFVTSVTNPSNLQQSSFLINHSVAYLLNTFLSMVEYIVELHYCPESKQFNWIAQLGLAMSIFGEATRKLSMFTAGSNFSHSIRETKAPSHVLVTHGIYRFMRHPSYAGWFYWAVGSQILLKNPFCAVIFFVLSTRFFRDRIKYEESTLIEFFGESYSRYKSKVGLWMPIA